jgi:general nucleoside transport system ATP-binding protein
MNLRAVGLAKSFGPTQALNDVSIEFGAGEVHAVLGENGAGKSTLVSVLSGFVLPDEGTVTLGNRSVPLGRPFECKRFGIEMIHQHFTLVPEFTVAENLALSSLQSLASKADVQRLAGPALTMAEKLGWKIEPSAKVRTLPVGSQQRVEILKALATEAPVLLFDEPTAVLSPDEVEDLFHVLRRLREEGRIVILIAHKLSEVLSVADRFSVLRRGKLVGQGARDEVNSDLLAEWMVGELPSGLQREATLRAEGGLLVRNLEVRGDRGELAVRSVSFEARPGEILGIGGVDGNGQIELA